MKPFTSVMEALYWICGMGIRHQCSIRTAWKPFETRAVLVKPQAMKRCNRPYLVLHHNQLKVQSRA